MKICRFNHSRIGIVNEDNVVDITHLFDLHIPWPEPSGDWVIRQMTGVMPRIPGSLGDALVLPLDQVQLESPVANPGKIIGAPINYKAHIDEANNDREINHGRTYTSIEEFGLFLKAGSSLIGPAVPVIPRFANRRTDHEVELAVIIGQEARRVQRKDALDYVFGYAIGLDMTVRGKEFPSFRKSPDTYCVLGPWIVTADEIANPNDLAIHLSVNGETRQDSRTNLMVFDVQRLIEYASSFYTLHPGDVLMTGTPHGVEAVHSGAMLKATVESIGSIEVLVQ